MICPYCVDPKTTDGYQTKVTDTRRFFDDVRRRFYMERKRVCTHCHQRFTTREFSPVIKEKTNHAT